LNKTITFIIGSFLLLASLSSIAIEVEDLYRVKIAVKDQSDKVRRSATLAAFKQVLVRKSGSFDILSAYEVQQSYKKVTRFLQRYEYNRIDISTNSPSKEPLNKLQQNNPFELLLDFEPRLIDQMVQQAGMPIWGSNRPLTILWLAIEHEFERQIIKEETELESLSQLINIHALRRGIPVILPLMDLEDQLEIGISDVWGRFSTPVINASRRYDADSIISGKLSLIGELWQARLSYISAGNEQRFELSAKSPELLVASLADKLAEFLCAKYCVVEVAESHQVVFQVSNISNFNQFKKVQKYLSGLSAIRKVGVEKIAGVNARFELNLLGELEAVKQAISLNNHLIEESAPINDPFDISTKNDSSENILNDILQDGVDTQNTPNSQNASQVNEGAAEKKQGIFYYRWRE